MNKLHLALAVVVGAVVLGVGFMVFSALSAKDSALGTVINPSNALNQQRLINDFNSITSDLQGLRSPLAGVLSTTTAAIGFPTIATSTAGVTTTTAPGLAAAAGDIVLIRESTSSPGFSFDGGVLTPSSTSATFYINARNNLATGAAAAPSSTVFYVTVIPRASFLAPAALNTSTST